VRVLGYASSTDANTPSIEVPPFHTGHLGFVPGTPVRVSLVAAPDSGRHCEVVVTPFEQEVRRLARVSVSMLDEPGVVARLIAAVAALGINIEVQESCSINLLNHHSVSLLVDLTQSELPVRAEYSADGVVPTPTSIRRLYHDYGSVFPVHDLRFVFLFESIMAHCADVIDWKTISGEMVPDISIVPYSDREIAKFQVRQLARGDKQLHVKFDVPESITPRLRQVVGEQSRFEYLLVSDTVTRALHVFFLHPSLASKLFHVGFFHDDVPGALATILALLRDAEFNILTSLVRKQEKGRSVWEAVVEYQGKEEVPHSDSRPAHSPITAEELEWICERVAAPNRGKKKLVDYGIDIAPPKYPVRPKDAKIKPIPLRDKLDLSPASSSPKQHYKQDKLLAQRRKALAKRNLKPDVERKSEQLLSLIEKRRTEDERPRVFISYPAKAKKQGEAVHKMLASKYQVSVYQEPNGEAIVDEVIRLIEGSDYFVGIWHHNEVPPEGELTREISPWMTFEYGVARTAEKPAIVVHSELLHPDIWKRIDSNIATPEYTEFDFDPQTLNTIWAYCERHFR
jgi:hypothetical protein